MGVNKQESRRSASFLKQGSLLAMASLVVRLIGMVYRIPMANILGDGNEIGRASCRERVFIRV